MVVLIAEDEAMVAFALAWALTAAGHEVLGPAYNMAEALHAIDGHKPDVALVNLVLQGGEDGAVLAGELLTLHGTPTLFVSEDIQAARVRHDVAIGLIRKPYDAEMIPAVVQFMDQLAQGHRPHIVPHAMELFA